MFFALKIQSTNSCGKSYAAMGMCATNTTVQLYKLVGINRNRYFLLLALFYQIEMLNVLQREPWSNNKSLGFRVTANRFLYLWCWYVKKCSQLHQKSLHYWGRATSDNNVYTLVHPEIIMLLRLLGLMTIYRFFNCKLGILSLEIGVCIWHEFVIIHEIGRSSNSLFAF